MANFNLNKVILGGRLTADPVLKKTSSGVAVTSFSIAVNRKYASQEEPATDFINIVAWRKTAEFVCKYFRKGSSICLEGSIQTRKWQNQNGETRSAVDVVASEVYFVDSKAEQSAQGSFAGIGEANMETLADDEDLPF
ncbi:MAG: single-stranded DNA-binding protein [Clostridiales bacterium]|nr:single-stranded DNA-binding protein [Clostridiales bacterium]